ncbi:Alpha/Beta hydrolase protein [Suillus subaureus]|uniref:Alpha/Beta hydrolase protein n=1 Tax=Suillus subaureus TaxID=48587 RepID=A0A9P7JH07_9AGAM|nr:Alpha/Beta hydrolase protein [Suillus subaureus]KAG1822670.1 Alpha/Beta hydrolase protein [Suillus subaureus]
MNNVHFPVQVVALFRRLVNVMATFSLSGQYLVSKVRVEDTSSNTPEVPTTPNDFWWNPLSPNKWDWLRVGLFVNSVLEQPTKPLTSTLPHRTLEGKSPRRCFFKDDTKSWPPNLSPSDSKVPSEPHTTALDTFTLNSKLPQGKLPPQEPSEGDSTDTIHRLLRNPALYDPIRAPRFPIVLCHGLYGFDVRGPAAFPSLRMHYWANVLNILKKKVGADVIVTAVPGTGSIASRAENLDRLLQEKARGRGVNFMAHSMGGLDCRHLITHVQPSEYTPLSLTTISTPHRGSPFMDWCATNIGLGRRPQEEMFKKTTEIQEQSMSEKETTTEKRETSFSLSLASLPSSFTTLLLSILDSPAYANLTSSYLNNVFNPATPNDPRVKYFSVTGRTADMSIWHPLCLPKMVLDELEREEKERLRRQHTDSGDIHAPLTWEQDDQWGNDGLVTVQSARWGEFLGTMEGCDHWEIRGARGLEFNVDLSSVPLTSIAGRVGADGWAFGDWSKFIRAWKKQEKGSSGGYEFAGAGGSSMSSSDPRVSRGAREEMHKEGESDPVVKASTDKLSAVFDWIIDQVPSTNKSPPGDTSQKQKVKKSVKHELASKLDLERFYVALSRKLYDEGL